MTIKSALTTDSYAVAFPSPNDFTIVEDSDTTDDGVPFTTCSIINPFGRTVAAFSSTSPLIARSLAESNVADFVSATQKSNILPDNNDRPTTSTDDDSTDDNPTYSDGTAVSPLADADIKLAQSVFDNVRNGVNAKLIRARVVNTSAEFAVICLQLHDRHWQPVAVLLDKDTLSCLEPYDHTVINK